MLLAGRGRATGHEKGQMWAIENRGVENGGNYGTEGYHRVKRSGSSERE